MSKAIVALQPPPNDCKGCEWPQVRWEEPPSWSLPGRILCKEIFALSKFWGGLKHSNKETHGDCFHQNEVPTGLSSNLCNCNTGDVLDNKHLKASLFFSRWAHWYTLVKVLLVWHHYTFAYLLTRGQDMFFVTYHTVNIFGFVSHTVSVTAIQLCSYSRKAATDNL